MNELKRIHVLRKIKDQEMTARQGAEALGLSLRQMRRLIARFDEDEPSKIAHGNRGIVSRRRIPEEMRDTIVVAGRLLLWGWRGRRIGTTTTVILPRS